MSRLHCSLCMSDILEAKKQVTSRDGPPIRAVNMWSGLGSSFHCRLSAAELFWQINSRVRQPRPLPSTPVNFAAFGLPPYPFPYTHTGHTGHTHTCTSSPICQLLMGGLQDWQTSWQKNWTLADQNSNWATGLRRMWEKLPERSWNQSQTQIQILNQNQRQRQGWRKDFWEGEIAHKNTNANNKIQTEMNECFA